jgi:hypothetical protein
MNNSRRQAAGGYFATEALMNRSTTLRAVVFVITMALIGPAAALADGNGQIAPDVPEVERPPPLLVPWIQHESISNVETDTPLLLRFTPVDTRGPADFLDWRPGLTATLVLRPEVMIDQISFPIGVPIPVPGGYHDRGEHRRRNWPYALIDDRQPPEAAAP